jgi:hypothetical protein
MSLQRLLRLATLALAAAAFAAGCEGSSDSRSATADASASSSTESSTSSHARLWTGGYPNSIAVLGHSGSTGENSDPNQPGVEVRANSWATGTNPKVDSLYRRVLAHNPGIKGHNMSYSEGGADVRELGVQADRALTSRRKPALIVIQIMDSDLTCPLDRGALSDFRKQLTSTLAKLGRRAPHSSQFVVSQFGSVDTYAKSLTREERAAQAGTGPCDFMTPSGGIAWKKVARLENAIHAYEAALKAACGEVRQCTYDGGAFGRIVDRRRYVSNDLNHFSVRGHAKAAAVAWAAMRRTHVLPRR